MKTESLIIDSHAHCGIIDIHPPQSFDDYLDYAAGSSIQGAVFFSPVIEIYDRYDPDFEDTPQWQERRRSSNEYLLGLDSEKFRVFPYFFIWNDFDVGQLTPQHKGIKWHRHAYEPHYDYDTAGCLEAIEEIRRRKMPVVLEEELKNTTRFINELAVGIRIIIPHLGFLNGGYTAIRDHDLWSKENVYTDTSLAPRGEILDYISRYGTERILFGSDFPFGEPKRELDKILGLPIERHFKEAICGGNLLRLLSDSNLVE